MGRPPVSWPDPKEVINSQEEAHPPRELVADGAALTLPIRASEQDAGPCPRRPDHDPPLRAPVIGQRWRVFHQIEPEHANEELDRRVVLVHHDRHKFEVHAKRLNNQQRPADFLHVAEPATLATGTDLARPSPQPATLTSTHALSQRRWIKDDLGPDGVEWGARDRTKNRKVYRSSVQWPP